MIAVDLRTTLISPQKRVWRLFPGSAYRFLDAFREGGVVFLDLPGLEFPEFPLVPGRELLQRVLVADAIAEQYQESGPNQELHVDPTDYEDARMGAARGRLVQAVINLYQEAAPGDVIVVPSRVWDEKILVGQLAGMRAVNTVVRREYGDTAIPARRVEWLSEIDERKVSAELSTSLRQQHPFSLIERSRYNEIFSIAYHNFYSSGAFSALLLNESSDFRDSDSAFIGLISNLAAYANYLNDRAELLSGSAATIDILSLFFDGVPADYSCALSSDIHSAGFTRLISSRATAITTAAILSILAGLALYSTQDTVAEDAQNVEVFNSLSPADDICTPKVSAASTIVLRSIGFDDLWKACQRAKAIQERTGLDTGVRTTERPAHARPR